jgi:hypothetical protein
MGSQEPVITVALFAAMVLVALGVGKLNDYHSNHQIIKDQYAYIQPCVTDSNYKAICVINNIIYFLCF